MAFPQSSELFHYSAANHPEIARVLRNRDVRDPVDDGVPGPSHELLDHRLSIARSALCRHNVEMVVDSLGEQLRDQLRRILQVDIYDDDPSAIRVKDSAKRRCRLSEPAAEHQALDARITSRGLRNYVLRPVRARIEREDDLVRTQTFEYRNRAGEERSNISFLLIDGHDDRDKDILTHGGAIERHHQTLWSKCAPRSCDLERRRVR